MRQKQVRLAALLAALLLCLSACGGGKQEEAGQTAAMPAAEVKPAALVTITLGEDPSSGYQWLYELDATGILKETGNTFQEQREGAGGARTWTFEAEGPGTVELRFGFKANAAGEATETIAYTFQVNEQKGITLQSSFGSVAEIPQPQMK